LALGFHKLRRCTLGDVAEFRNGKSLSPSLYLPEGRVVVWGSNGPIARTHEVLTDRPVLVIGRVGAFCGSVHRTEAPAWVTDNAILAEPKSGTDFYFLYYLLRSLKLNRTAIGSAQPLLTQGGLKVIELLLPELSIQTEIGRILAVLDDKIDLNRRMSQTLEAMAQELFRSWFLDFDPVRAKAESRQPKGMDAQTAALFPSRFVDSEIGEVPEGWTLSSFGDVLAELETGSRPKGGVGGIVEGVPSIGAESITRIGEYDFSKTKYVPREFFASMKKGLVRSWDVLLYKDGGRPGEFEPKVSLVGDGFPYEEMSINEHVYRLRGSDQLSQSFVYLLLASEPVKEELRRRGTGVAIPGLNSTALRTMLVLLPPRHVVQRFDAITAPLLRAILRNSLESKTLAEIRDTLLPRLLSGEIRVSDVEPQLAVSVSP
jgi:type I restriction enzyme S subunit